MDTLQRVVLGEAWKNIKVNRRWENTISRRRVVLYIQDRDGKVYELDIVKGIGSGEIRQMAEKLSIFCGIPLVDNFRDSTDEINPSDRK